MNLVKRHRWKKLFKETDYIIAIRIFSAFGGTDRIKKIWKSVNNTNTFYLSFSATGSDTVGVIVILLLIKNIQYKH